MHFSLLSPLAKLVFLIYLFIYFSCFTLSFLKENKTFPWIISFLCVSFPTSLSYEDEWYDKFGSEGKIHIYHDKKLKKKSLMSISFSCIYIHWHVLTNSSSFYTHLMRTCNVSCCAASWEYRYSKDSSLKVLIVYLGTHIYILQRKVRWKKGSGHLERI